MSSLGYPASPAGNVEPLIREARDRQRRRRAWIVLAVVCGASAGVAVFFATQGGQSTGNVVVPGEPSLRVGGAPIELVSGRGAIWVLTCDRGCTGEARSSVGRVVRIDPRSARATASSVIDRPQAITAGKEGVFGLDFWRGDVYRLDPTTLHVAGRLHLTLPFRPNDRAFLPETISLGEGTLWVTSNRGVVARIDPRSLRLIGTAFLEPATLDAVAAGNGAAWAAAELDGVARLDPHTHRVTARVRIERGSHALSVSQTLLGGGKVLAIGNWANGHVATGTNALARIDPKTSQVEGVTLLPGPRLALTLGAGWLWAGRVGGTMVERIDPASGRVAGRIEGRIGDALTIGSGYLWTITRTGTVTRLAPAITSS